jgi:hypothetical protein
MRRPYAQLLSILAVAFVSASAHAGAINTGVDPGRTPDSPLPHRPATTCHVLWFGNGSGDEIARISGLGPIVTQTFNTADLSAANLANYNVLVVAYTPPGIIGGSQADIQSFVLTGGALLIHQPNADNAVLDYAPAGFGVTITAAGWCNYPDASSAQGHIVNGAHPITTGITDADLSGAFDLVGSIGPGYTVLAVNASCLDPALAVGTLGSGRVVFEDGNANSGAFIPGSDNYWANVFD